MKDILRRIDKEIGKKLEEVEALKTARAAVAKLIPGHPYGRPKLTMAKFTVRASGAVGHIKRKKLHWTQTPKGRRVLARRARKQHRDVAAEAKRLGVR